MEKYRATRLAQRYEFKNENHCELKSPDIRPHSEAPFEALNMSASGMAFVVRDPVLVNQILVGQHLWLDLKPFFSTPFKCRAIVVRSDDHPDGRLYAVRFIGLPRLIEDRLIQSIREQEFADKLSKYGERPEKTNRRELWLRIAFVAAISLAVSALSYTYELIISGQI